MVVEFKGGSNDGLKFTLIDGVAEDGREITAWTCNHRPGYFRQVFIPLDFEHPDMVPK